MKIEPVFISIGSLFMSQAIFRIPKYQRNYAWTDSEIDDFISDLRKCFVAKQQGRQRPHFFGGIVSIRRSIPGSARNQYDLVDGQQRMATFVLLMAGTIAIYKLLKQEAVVTNDSNNEELIKGRLDTLTQQFLDFNLEINRRMTLVSRLKVSEPDQHFFNPLIHGQPLPSEDRESHKRLSYAYNTIYRYLTDEVTTPLSSLSDKLDALKTIEEILNDDLTIIHIVTETEREAYRLFQVLNNRGINLTEGDLLRSISLGLLESSTFNNQQQRTNEAWNEILRDTPGDTEDFLRWYYSSVRGRRPGKSSLLEDFLGAFFPQHEQEDIVQSVQEADAIVDAVCKLEEEIGICRKLIEGRWPYPHTPPITQWDRDRLRLLTVELKHTNCMPLLLAAAIELDQRDFSEIVQCLERFAFRYKIISNQHISPATRVYLEEATSIRSSSPTTPYQVASLKSKLRNLIGSNATDVIFRSNLEELEYKTRGSNKPLKYFLITIEHFARWYHDGATGEPQCLDRTRVFDFANTTIEHIYPQNPKVHHSSLDPLTNTLGNLTFLGPTDNQNAGNDDFSVKKPIFQNSSVSLNQDIGNETNWNENSISRHKNRLINMALRIFVV